MRHLLLSACFLLACPLAGQDAKPAQQIPVVKESIEVTASRVEQSVLDAPVAVTVVNRQQIDTAPAGTYADLLRGVPGVSVIQTSASGLSIRTRGPTKIIENAQLVMIDGRSIYLDYYGFVIWDFLPVSLDEIDAIDVMRGPGSSVWGSNALNGVINLRTRSPRDMAGGLFTASVGERGTRAATVRWAGAAGPWSYKASAGFFEQEPWPRDNKLPDGSPFPFGYTYQNRRTRQPKGDVRADRELGADSTLSVRAGYAGTQGIFHSSIGPFAILPGSHVNYEDVDYTRGPFELKAYSNHLIGDAPSVLNGILFKFENRTTVLEANNRTLLGDKQMIVYGLSGRDNHFILSLAPDRHTRRDGGVYVEDIAAVAPWLELNIGARADHFATLGTVVSPRISVILKPAPNQSIRLAANRAYRAPTLIENYLNTAVPNVIFLGAQPFFFLSRTIGNEHLKQESVDALELGWSMQRGPFSIDASVYRNSLRNNIVFFPTEFFGPAEPPPGWPGPGSTVPLFALPKTFSFLNVGTVRNSGLELSAETTLDRGLHLRAAYAYQRNPQVAAFIAGVPLPVNKPPHHTASVLAYVRGKRWIGSSSVAYTGAAYWADVLDSRFWGTTPGYTLVNAALGCSVSQRTEVVLSGTNLLNRKIRQHVFGDTIGRKISIELRERF